MLGAASDAFDRRQAEFESAFQRRQAAYEREFDARQKEYVEFFRRRIDELERRAEGAEARLKKIAEAIVG